MKGDGIFMGNVESVAKYNLEKEEFEYNVNPLDKGKAYSIANFQDIINDESSDKFDYIIYIDGYRLENITKDFENVSESKTAVKHILDYYKKQKRNVRLKQILVDNDGPLEKEAIMLANFIDQLSSTNYCNSVNIIGHSKGGTIAFNTPKYFINQNSYKNTNIYTDAVPFNGCIMASPKIFYRNIKQLIYKVIPNQALAEKVYKKITEYYEGMSSNSHMDNDIAIENSIFERYSDKYDVNYVRNMFDLQNISAIKRINHYQNIQTGIDDKTLLNSLKNGDFLSVGLCIIDKYLINDISDGFVEVSSQEAVEDKIEQDNIRFNSTTHNVLSNKSNMDKIMQMLEDNLLESFEINKFENRHLK